jgi:peptidoglycan/xylan/chitin deacetylase (PgdA/CDA1 family)
MDLFHRTSHSECLTVVMFHRVLPGKERERMEADPLYTVTPELLLEIATFLKQNYAVIGIKDVISSLNRERPLPPRPVLVTFDDGWRDNLEWAMPALRGIPWVLFVAADAVSEPEYWWQEVLLWALRTGQASFGELWEAATPAGVESEGVVNRPDILALLIRYGDLAPDRRRTVLVPLETVLRSRCNKRHMLSTAELAALQKNGVSIGSHGASHLPFTIMTDPAGDLMRAMQWLRKLQGTPVLSFPHGRYNATVLRAARELACAAIFTSDPVLNPCPGGWLQSDLIGRVSMIPANVTDNAGRFAPDRLASQLYLRDVASPTGRAA